MIVKFNDYQGKERKPLVMAIEDITGLKGVYTMKAPTQFAYVFDNEGDYIILAKDGTLTADNWVITKLEQAGFVGEIEGDDGEVEEITETESESETAEIAEDAPDESAIAEDTITIEIPKQGSLSDEKLQNLLKLAESKHTLITKALGKPLIIQDGGENVQFVFPYNEEVGIAQIYSQLAYAMTRYVKKHQRVTATEKEVESEKFALRAWMVKLGMNGAEYGACRKWFMRNLSGNASFSSNAKYTEMQDSRRKSEVNGDE
jgi:hypothetical protein